MFIVKVKILINSTNQTFPKCALDSETQPHFKIFWTIRERELLAYISR